MRGQAGSGNRAREREGKATGDRGNVGGGCKSGDNGDIRRISPLFNDVFLKTFGESEESARSFANSVLRSFGMPELGEIERMEIDSTRPSTVNVKAPRCDVVLVAGNQTVDLEPQLRYVNVDNKTLFYGSRLLSEGAPKGADDGYGKLPQIVVIMLLQGRKRFKGKQFITRCRMTWEREEGPVAGSDCVTVILVEMDKVAEEYNGLTEDVLADELTAWLYLLARGYRSSEETAEIMDYFPDMKSFAEHYGLAIEDPDTKRAFNSYQLDLWENAFIEEQEEKDRQAAFEAARKQGHDEGLKLGYDDGLKSGYDEGHEQGYDAGRKSGYDDGREQGYDAGHEQGYEDGQKSGYDEGLKLARDEFAAKLRALGVAEKTISEAMR